jgi:hypothetical protein
MEMKRVKFFLLTWIAWLIGDRFIFVGSKCLVGGCLHRSSNDLEGVTWCRYLAEEMNL